MGIQGLLPQLKSTMVPIRVEELRGQTVAVDTYSWLHKGALSCSDSLCKGIRTTRHINYCMHRVDMLRHYGVKPILVFDGGFLPIKGDQETKRERSRKENLERAREHEAAGNSRAAFECYQKAVDITPRIAFELIQVLKEKKVDYIVAPYEADAQMTFLSVNKLVDAVITEDSDLIPFGCSRDVAKGIALGNIDPLTKQPFEVKPECSAPAVEKVYAARESIVPSNGRKRLDLPVQKNILTNYFCLASLEAKRKFRAPKITPKQQLLNESSSPSPQTEDSSTPDSVEDTSLPANNIKAFQCSSEQLYSEPPADDPISAASQCSSELFRYEDPCDNSANISPQCTSLDAGSYPPEDTCIGDRKVEAGYCNKSTIPTSSYSVGNTSKSAYLLRAISHPSLLPHIRVPSIQVQNYNECNVASTDRGITVRSSYFKAVNKRVHTNQDQLDNNEDSETACYFYYRSVLRPHEQGRSRCAPKKTDRGLPSKSSCTSDNEKTGGGPPDISAFAYKPVKPSDQGKITTADAINVPPDLGMFAYTSMASTACHTDRSKFMGTTSGAADSPPDLSKFAYKPTETAVRHAEGSRLAGVTLKAVGETYRSRFK
ncbi:hypothetical protein PR202_gb04575 [Eleusine coracana subsp. coracana]|uniref:Exonuclease 1 n=1 Tax=Eleusine coracana subsp. coracana TaxID=191504 RepID=A0AAV5E518_ELECO|nr:hypothetical protein PR202_gb04575 [Eleusine coracana subsp. coracana]